MDAYFHQLHANLDAMRHLPGGTRLPQPSTAEERALLADLVHLPDSIDPLQWLRDERGPLAARITLYETLGFLKNFVGPPGLSRAMSAPWCVMSSQGWRIEPAA